MKKTLLSKGWTLHAPHFHGQVDLPNDYAVTAPRDPHAAQGNAAAEVADFTHSFLVDAHENLLADTHDKFVNRVVDHFFK